VAVKRPAAGIVGIKGDGKGCQAVAPEWYRDTAPARELRYPDDLRKGLALTVHRMRLIVWFHHLDRHTRTVGDISGVTSGQCSAVQ